MFPGMNPRQLQKAMKQMGIKQEDIDATQVIITTATSKIIIDNPSVAKVNAMGQESFQISGSIREEALSTTPDISKEDVETVMNQANVDEETATKAIEEAKGDLAQAILSLHE